MTGERHPEPITTAQALRLAKRFIRLGKKQKTMVAVAGGLAMQLYGHTRNTRDVDLVAEKPIHEARHYHWKHISFGGNAYRIHQGARSFVIDVIVRDDTLRSMYECSLQATRIIRGVPVVSPEYLILMKLDAGRGKDISDIQYLLAERITTIAKAVRLAKVVGGGYFARQVKRQLGTLKALAALEQKKYKQH